ncbi:MAG: transporter substrate-binding domain-containing protein [Synergistaceae bacterium]|nr:transporter substrate-binding domain-containing protein [Synergistaceae bacterium]
MKKYILLSLSVIILIAVGLYLSRYSDEAENNKVFRIGVECDYAPNNWEENRPSEFNFPIANHKGYYAEGYDLQIAKRIADEMNATLEVRKIEWEYLIPALKKGEIDAIFSGMLDTEERKHQISFSDTYEVKETEYAVVVNTSTPYVSADSLTDFSGAKFIGQKNTKLYASISQIPGAVALPAVDTVSEMIGAITGGRADGIVINLDTGRSYEAAYKNLKVIRFPEGEGFHVGFNGICAGVRKNDTELLRRINKILKGLSHNERQKIMDMVVSRLWKSLS